MDLREALDFLDAHINREATAGLLHGLSLESMQRLMSVLGDPQHAFRVVHVTGTNGKGSTSRMVSALLEAHGLVVGTYASPHLQRINERISLNGEPISDEDFAAVVTDLARLAPLSGVTPSYFELLTAGAFQWFAENAVDVAVIEVGLLGRYDATNVADADVAVVTNVGRDHTDGEGDWELAIATEKAGIIKPGSRLVSGITDRRLQQVLRAEGPAAAWFRPDDLDVLADRPAVGGRVVDLRTPFAEHRDVFVPLHGFHQAENLALAISAVEAFFERAIGDDLIAEAVSGLAMPGRFEVVAHHPLVIIDGAHNPEGARSATRTLHDEFDTVGRRVLVVGMLSGRDPVEMLECLDARSMDLVICCSPGGDRAVPASHLAEIVRAMGVMAEQVDDVGTAVARAIDVSTDDDVVLIAGSLYVAGAARTAIESLRREGVV